MMSAMSRNDVIEFHVDVWKPLILQLVDVKKLLSYMSAVVSTVQRDDIQREPSKYKSTEMLLGILKHSKEPGRWTCFLDALEHNGYDHLLNVLNGKTEENETMQSQRTLIKVFAPEIERSLDATTISIDLVSSGTLDETDVDSIKTAAEMHGRVYGVWKLIELVPARQTKWFKTLLNVLSKNGYTQLVHDIDDRYEKDEDTTEKCHPSKDNFDSSCAKELFLSNCEKSEKPDDDQFAEQKSYEDKKADSTVPSHVLKPKNLTAELRKYQLELAEVGEQGNNCVIIAPTNTGKTHVAMKIIQERLKVMKVKKTVFLVPTNILAKQQGTSCQEYLQCQSDFTSGEKQQNELEQGEEVTTVTECLNKNDVVVLTAQLLLNALKREKLTIHELGLIIFDECHHTNERHPYNLIMLHYLEKKLNGQNTPDELFLPQIIGLTASPGVGGANEISKAKQWIKKFMSNMDADYLVTVRKHVKEMELFANIPVQEIIETEQRLDDSFGCELLALCENLITKMRENGEQFALSFSCKPGTDQFTQKLSEGEKILLNIPDDKALLYREMKIIWNYLKIYHEALMIYKDARIKDALQFIENSEETLVHEREDEFPVISEIKQDFRACKLKELSCNIPSMTNPKLETLKNIILEQFNSKTNSRVLVFVKTLNLLNQMLLWMEESPEFMKHQPVKIVGSKEQTKASTLQNVKNFEKGISKIALATSVAEEGIDIQLCNLVVLYDHVTNEIARVQTKGRGRHFESKYILITSKDGAAKFKEQQNIVKEMLMEEAIKNVQGEIEKNPQDFWKYKEEFQRKCIKEMHSEELAKLLSQKERDKRYSFTCECRQYLTCTDNMRIAGTHHICINTEILSQAKIKDKIKRFHTNSEMDMHMYRGLFVCRSCNKTLGGVMKYKNLWFPLLGIKNILVKGEGASAQSLKFKKWCDLPHANIKVFDDEDLTNMMDSDDKFCFDQFEETRL